MLPAVWIALGIGVLAALAGVAAAAVKGLRGWRSLGDVRRAITRMTDDTLAAAERAAARASELTERLEAVSAATARLEASLAELGVLTGAAAEVRDAVERLQGSVPRK